MRPDYLWTISTPEAAWNRVNDRVINLLGGCEAIVSDRYKAGHEYWESDLGDHKLELVGYLYVLVVLMRNNDRPDVAAQIQEILDLITPADLSDPEVRNIISAKHQEINPYSWTNQQRSRRESVQGRPR